MRWRAELVVPCTLEIGFNLEEPPRSTTGCGSPKHKSRFWAWGGSRECFEARISVTSLGEFSVRPLSLVWLIAKFEPSSRSEVTWHGDTSLGERQDKPSQLDRV